MKMHPKPARRHRSYVEPVKATVIYDGQTPQPYHIRFTHGDGSTQLLVMTRKDAEKICLNIAAMLRYGDQPIADVDTNELVKFHDQLKELISP